MQLFDELKRRNVFRVGIAYAVTSWLLIQVADIVLETMATPDWVMKTLLALLLLGFPLALLFAWAFEVTPEGIKRESEVDRSTSITHETRHKLDVAIIIVLVAALGYFVVDKFVLSQGSVRQTLAEGPAASSSAEPAGTVGDAPGASNIGQGDGAAPEKSIAVLPFVNLSSDPEQEFFSDGISEELLNVLAQYPGLRVAARTSSFQFKGQNQDIGEIARLLKVKHILEGSVRKAGSQLRITAQLISADNGYHLWSQTYDRELNDVFAIQDEISSAIGEALRVELALNTTGETDAPRVAESGNTAAYEAFLKGRQLIAKRGRKNITEGVENLERSVRLDPNYAPSQAWLSIGITLLRNSPTTYGDYTLAQVQALATPHMERALELAPDLAEAHGARGSLASASGDYALAVEAFSRAVELNPVFVDAINWGQIASQAHGDYRTAVAQIETLIEVDPLSVIGRLNYISTMALARPEQSRALAMGLIEQSPWAGYLGMGYVTAYADLDLSTATGWMLRAYEQSPLDDFSNRMLIFMLSMVGETDEARRISDLSSYIADIFEGNHESVVYELERRYAADPGNAEARMRIADSYFRAGKMEQALNLYLQQREGMPGGVIFGAEDLSISHARMVWLLAQNGRLEEASEAAAQLEEQINEQEALGIAYDYDFVSLAIMAMAAGDQEAGLARMHEASRRGLRDVRFFGEPAFAALQSDPEFLTIKADIRSELDKEHAEILQLICHNNPVPEAWQPLEKTCAGVAPAI